MTSTLAERGSRYGEFTTHAKYTQALKRVLQSSPNWAAMDDDQREALEMVAHKVGRILNGDPNYADSWHDIAGYAQLVDNRLAGAVKSITVPAGVITPDTMADFKKPGTVEVAPAPFRAPVIVTPPPAAQPPSVVAPPTLSLGTVKAPDKSGE